MRLEKLEIENFRGIEHAVLDFQDELGRIRDLVPIVGPNTSGKTTILDAIALCLMPPTELIKFRRDLALSPSSLVRRGSVRARVTCTLRFSDEEIAEAKEVLERVDSPYASTVSSESLVTVHWEYPDPRGTHKRGRNTIEPRDALGVFKARVTTVRNLHVPGVTKRRLEQLGGVFMFDQKRTGLSQRMPASMRSLTARGGEEEEERGADAYTDDARRILLLLATRAQAIQGPETTEREDFRRLCDLYARVCNPHRIKGLYNAGPGLDVEFEGPQGIYLFDGLSSGQQMLLLLLLQFATNRIHRSIVLIDELELHLHPLWQTRLYEHLGDLGKGNQILFTTHSLHLRDLIRGEFFHCTGDLGEKAVAKREA